MSHLQRSIYNKFIDGDPLSNYEIDAGAEFHKNLANELAKLGPVFYTAFRESNRVAMAMIEFQNARKVKKDQDDLHSASYNEGYQCGLTWDADWTPGGPNVYHATSRFISGEIPAERLEMERVSKEHARLWMMGWKAGMKVDPNKMITKFMKWSGKPIPPVRSGDLFTWAA